MNNIVADEEQLMSKKSITKPKFCKRSTFITDTFNQDMINPKNEITDNTFQANSSDLTNFRYN